MDELVRQGKRNLTVITNDPGLPGVGVGKLVTAGLLLETALRADFALVHAFVADYIGNLTYVLTARNFNPVIAMAADTVIVTADHVVPVGVIAPDQVATPAPVVDYIVACA